MELAGKVQHSLPPAVLSNATANWSDSDSVSDSFPFQEGAASYL